jgi:acyl-CoA reductase-like NAD-dependent aldehyde dehydrogenase
LRIDINGTQKVQKRQFVAIKLSKAQLLLDMPSRQDISQLLDASKLHPFIDGVFRPNSAFNPTPKTLPILDPTCDATLCQVTVGTAADVDAAVQAAKKAYPQWWESTTPEQRRNLLWKLADKMEAEKVTLAQLESMNCGKPIAQATYDVSQSIECFRYFSGSLFS